MNQNISRRDWFRLRVAEKNSRRDGLKPVAPPPNHDGMDLKELPPMREATLSTEQVNDLIRDIQKFGNDILLMQRPTDKQPSANSPRASASKVESFSQLEMAKTALLAGTVPRIQIRYQWQSQQWIDTLKREPDGIHVVRIAHKLT